MGKGVILVTFPMFITMCSYLAEVSRQVRGASFN